MNREEFNELLKNANLTKRSFCEILGLNYNSVNNWGSSDIQVPNWVKSWLENYIKAKRFDEVVELITPYLHK